MPAEGGEQTEVVWCAAAIESEMSPGEQHIGKG
jgi:hypothetical protein